MQKILNTLASIAPLDQKATEAARTRQQELTKPAGSLGRLEEIAIQLAGITGRLKPEMRRKAVIVMAGDHGVTAEGVSAYPAEVTPQMVYNFLRGGAAINALAKFAGARVIIVDIGVAAEIAHTELISRKVAYGTANMAKGAAMTREQMVEAIAVGIDVFEAQFEQGIDVVATGDMGIGNTTASSAIAAVLLSKPVSSVTGRGTGINDEQLAHKVEVIERALDQNRPDPRDPFDVLMKVGGFEIAGLAGVIIAAAARRVPVVIDGLISGAAALLAVEMQPIIRDYLFAGHRSVEQGHRLMLEHMQLAPLLDLNLRLGEGTGAVLAMSIIEAALHAHNEMATFAEAGVSEKENE